MAQVTPETEHPSDRRVLVGLGPADRFVAPELRDTIRRIDSVMLAVDGSEVPQSAPWLYALASVNHYHASLSRLVYLQITKPVLDAVLTLIALIIVIPIALVVTLLILATTREPVLFRQTRIGQGGRPFTVYKFRTMVNDRRRDQQVIPFPDRRLRHKSERDPRVTPIGAFLRRTSLDEIPQLINVLRGEMSLVGPRPELPSIVERYEDWQHVRHLVRPGITGWWQVNGRSDLPMHENTGLDIEYVQRVSFWMDVRIILRTIRIVFSGSGAF